jgi:hypothetical protein
VHTWLAKAYQAPGLVSHVSCKFTQQLLALRHTSSLTHLIAIQHCVHPQLILTWSVLISSKITDLIVNGTTIDGEAGHKSMTTRGLLAQVNVFHLHQGSQD